MNREILFIGKRKDNGEWVSGYLFNDGMVDSNRMFIGEIVIEDYQGSADDRFDITGTHFYEVIPETVCQYTGLTDKNGRKIFEGYIVKTSQYGVDDGSGHNYAGFDTFSIEFSDGGFCLKNKWRRYNLRPSGNIAVIGNIFDNPELLEVNVNE